MSRQYYVYIMTSTNNQVLYTGVTNNLLRRVNQHRDRANGGFAQRYHASKLVYFEIFQDSYNAISREKQIKAGSRRKKIELVEQTNPAWRDLFGDLWPQREMGNSKPS